MDNCWPTVIPQSAERFWGELFFTITRINNVTELIIMQKVLTVKARFHIMYWSFRFNLSLFLTCRQCTCNIAVGTAFNTATTGEHLPLAARSIADLYHQYTNYVYLSQLHKHVGRKDQDGSLAGDFSSCIRTGGAATTTVCRSYCLVACENHSLHTLYVLTLP